MSALRQRRALLCSLLLGPWLGARSVRTWASSVHAAQPIPVGRPIARIDPAAQFGQIEQRAQACLGVCALDTGSATRIAYRANRRFPMDSLWKLLAVADLLARSVDTPALMQQQLAIHPQDLLPGALVTMHHVGGTLSVEQLCAAAIRYSDNTAGNLLLQVLGGPPAVTAYARALGDPLTRLDRNEPAVNSAEAGDLRDTTTPAAMLDDLRKILLQDALPPAQTALLQSWLCSSMLGAQRIRAGLPAGWQVGDKTAGGINGVNNDLAIIWPPQRAPILLGIFVERANRTDEGLPQVIAEATRVVAEAFA